MKKLTAILAGLLLTTVAGAQEFQVQKKAATRLRLSNVAVNETARVVEETGVGSHIDLKITADYTAGYHNLKDVSLLETNVNGDCLDTEETSIISILGEEGARENQIRLGDMGGISGSTGKIMIPVRIDIGCWSGRMTTHQFNYNLASGRDQKIVKTIVVNFDLKTGWTISN